MLEIRLSAVTDSQGGIHIPATELDAGLQVTVLVRPVGKPFIGSLYRPETPFMLDADPVETQRQLREEWG